MKSGIYRIYAVAHDGDDHEKQVLGRVVVSNGHTHVVEDRDGRLSRVIPDGYIDAQKAERWRQLSASAYYAVVSEADLEPEEIQQPEVKPDEVFEVIDDTLGTRRRLEVYADDLFLDDKHLEPREAEKLMNEIRLGHLHLIPVV